LLEMILPVAAVSGSESPGLSGGRLQPGWAGGACWPRFFPSAAGVLGAQRDDAGGAVDGPVPA
jgi:hypothetical protein